MTPEQLRERIEIADEPEYLDHRPGGPVCVATCGKGQTPDRILHDKKGELHGFITDNDGFQNDEDAEFVSSLRTLAPHLLALWEAASEFDRNALRRLGGWVPAARLQQALDALRTCRSTS